MKYGLYYGNVMKNTLKLTLKIAVVVFCVATLVFFGVYLPSTQHDTVQNTDAQPTPTTTNSADTLPPTVDESIGGSTPNETSIMQTIE